MNPQTHNRFNLCLLVDLEAFWNLDRQHQYYPLLAEYITWDGGSVIIVIFNSFFIALFRLPRRQLVLFL